MRQSCLYSCLALSLLLILFANPGAAQFGREPGTDRGAGGEREGGIPRDQVLQEQQDGQDTPEGTEEGMPALRTAPDGRRVTPYFLPPDRHRWRLGVYAFNTDTGVVITRVLPGSAARRQGLEPGDRIVTVDGHQVGWVGDWLYPLGAELQRHAGPRGTVLLLVQNVRNQRLLNLFVPLEPAEPAR